MNAIPKLPLATSALGRNRYRPTLQEFNDFRDMQDNAYIGMKSDLMAQRDRAQAQARTWRLRFWIVAGLLPICAALGAVVGR